VASWFAGLASSRSCASAPDRVPLRAVMDAADRVAGGDYTRASTVHGPPPVRALARAVQHA
jgi:hypothetical protein